MGDVSVKKLKIDISKKEVEISCTRQHFRVYKHDGGLVKMWRWCGVVWCGDARETSVETSTAAQPSSPANLATVTVALLQVSLDKTLVQLSLPMTRP